MYETENNVVHSAPSHSTTLGTSFHNTADKVGVCLAIHNPQMSLYVENAFHWKVVDFIFTTSATSSSHCCLTNHSFPLANATPRTTGSRGSQSSTSSSPVQTLLRCWSEWDIKVLEQLQHSVVVKSLKHSRRHRTTDGAVQQWAFLKLFKLPVSIVDCLVWFRAQVYPRRSFHTDQCSGLRGQTPCCCLVECRMPGNRIGVTTLSIYLVGSDNRLNDSLAPCWDDTL